MARLLSFLLVCAVMLGACVSPAPTRETGPVRIGLYADLTAAGARDGNDASRGAALRVAEANASGGVGGRIVELVIMDARTSPADAVKAYTALAQQGVCAILGVPIANAGVAVSPVADLMRVPFVSLGVDDRVTLPDAAAAAGSATATSPSSAPRPYSFMVRPTSMQLAASLAAWAAGHMPWKRYATLCDPADVLSTLQARSFEETVRKAGREVAASVVIPADGADFTAALAALASADADAVYVCGTAAQDAAFAAALRQSGPAIGVLGNQGWDGLAGSAAGVFVEGVVYALGIAPDDRALSDMRQRMAAAYGADAGAASVYGWDAVGLVLAAVRKAGSSVPTRVRDALELTKGYRLLQGSADMGRVTHRLSPLPVAVIKVTGSVPAALDPRWIAPAALRLP
jgi:branched-chain amino acid transport system substrate-binding protein